MEIKLKLTVILFLWKIIVDSFHCWGQMWVQGNCINWEKFVIGIESQFHKHFTGKTHLDVLYFVWKCTQVIGNFWLSPILAKQTMISGSTILWVHVISLHSVQHSSPNVTTNTKHCLQRSTLIAQAFDTNLVPLNVVAKPWIDCLVNISSMQLE